MTPGDPLLHVARPKGVQHATHTPSDATPCATAMQQGSIKSLAEKVLARNSLRNGSATEAGKPCNSGPHFAPPKVARATAPAEPLPTLARTPDPRGADDRIRCADCGHCAPQLVRGPLEPRASVQRVCLDQWANQGLLYRPDLEIPRRCPSFHPKDAP